MNDFDLVTIRYEAKVVWADTSSIVLVGMLAWTAGGEDEQIITSSLQTVLYQGDIIILHTNWSFHDTRVVEGDVSITLTKDFVWGNKLESLRTEVVTKFLFGVTPK